jgi:hypothetical protein
MRRAQAALNSSARGAAIRIPRDAKNPIPSSASADGACNGKTP